MNFASRCFEESSNDLGHFRVPAHARAPVVENRVLRVQISQSGGDVLTKRTGIILSIFTPKDILLILPVGVLGKLLDLLWSTKMT